jgi:DNA-binding NtrC family response regulator
LAEYFLSRYARRNSSVTADLTPDAAAALESYAFPGNIRELEHLVERVAVKAGGMAITAEQIQEELTATKAPEKGAFDAKSAIALPFHEAVTSWERHLIEQAIKASQGNKSDAARRLGIHRRLLYEKLAQLGML